jgi:integrase
MVKKRKNPSGKTVWFYCFDAPASTRTDRRRIREFGFATKDEATKAEAARRIEEQQKYDLARAGSSVAAAPPKTLSGLMEEFFRQHAQEKLAVKTTERYRESVKYIDGELLAMPLEDITALHLNREWSRLLKSGGHTRKDKTPRPLSAKSVRNIAGVISAAFSRAIKWQLLDSNPVTHSEPPRANKHLAIALTPAQQETILDAASGPWCMRPYLEIAAATGCRRGELLALRWSDIVDGCAMIARSLTQTFRIVDTPEGKVRVHDVLEFKGTKTEKPRPVSLPSSAIAVLDAHRLQQDEFRRQYGADYRADLDLIFANPNGSPLQPDSISATVSALFKRLKIPKPKGAALHLFRHSHTSVLLSEGVPLPAVSARLGHSSVRTTQEIYAHMLTGQDEEAAKKWEEYQKRNRPAEKRTDVQ